MWDFEWNQRERRERKQERIREGEKEGKQKIIKRGNHGQYMLMIERVTLTMIS